MATIFTDTSKGDSEKTSLLAAAASESGYIDPKVEQLVRQGLEVPAGMTERQENAGKLIIGLFIRARDGFKRWLDSNDPTAQAKTIRAQFEAGEISQEDANRRLTLLKGEHDQGRAYASPEISQAGGHDSATSGQAHFKEQQDK